MSDISKVDKNFKVETKTEKDDIEFYNADSELFEIFSVYKKEPWMIAILPISALHQWQLLFVRCLVK